jgi:hypothetical protein
MAGGAKMPSFARIAQKIFMTTVIAADPCKSAMQIAALQIAVNHIHHIGAPKTAAGCETVIPYVLEFFKVVLNALKIIAVLGIAGAIDVRNDIFFGLVQHDRRSFSRLRK